MTTPPDPAEFARLQTELERLRAQLAAVVHSKAEGRVEDGGSLTQGNDNVTTGASGVAVGRDFHGNVIVIQGGLGVSTPSASDSAWAALGLQRNWFVTENDGIVSSQNAEQLLRAWIEALKVSWVIEADPAAKSELQKKIEQAIADLAILRSLGLVAPPIAQPAVFANPAADKLFVGRGPELAQMRAALLGPIARPVALVGMAGVGKSYLADHFLFGHQDEFPGGIFRLEPRSGDASVPAAHLLLGLVDDLNIPPAPAADLADLADRLRVRLLTPRSLLRVENVDDKETGRVVAELARRLIDCPLIITGRLLTLGSALGAGWSRIEVRKLSRSDALDQLRLELGEDDGLVATADRERLVHELEYLPLGIHLAAGYLQVGQSVDQFLAGLRTSGIDLVEPVDPADPVRATFRTSLAHLGRQLGPERAHILEGFKDLGFAPTTGFGASLGAALADLSAADFGTLTIQAFQLSVLEPMRGRERSGRGWRVHPLLAELLRKEKGEGCGELASRRMTEWFLARLPKERQGQAWSEVGEEVEALVGWLETIPSRDHVLIERAGSLYAMLNGPFHAWTQFCEKVLDGPLTQEQRSDALLTLGRTTLRGGALDRAFEIAQECERTAPLERQVAHALCLRADVLEVRGDWKQALLVRREQQLPLFEKLGDQRMRVSVWSQIADVLIENGELDEALRIRREEQVPFFDGPDDLLDLAASREQIADILRAKGELDEALQTYADVREVYEGLGAERL